MSLADAAALAQIVSAILIIPSLVYLAWQIRQNTQQAQASAASQFLEINKDLNLALIGNKQMASVYRRGVARFEELDEDERTQFFFFVAQYFQAFSNMHDLWRRGAMPDAAWHPVRKHLIAMMQFPSMRHVFDSWARGALPANFVAYVDQIAGSGEATYSLEKTGILAALQ